MTSQIEMINKYQPSNARGTQSQPATPYRLHNPKGSGNKIFYSSTPSLRRKMTEGKNGKTKEGNKIIRMEIGAPM